MAVTVSAGSAWFKPSTTILVRAAALCAAGGIALSITENGEYGSWVTLVGVVLLIVGLHRLGRSGPDDAIVFELTPQPRKKKRKKRPGSSEAAPE